MKFHPCLWWNVSYCLHVFAEMKFHPGMKKKKKDVWTLYPGMKFWNEHVFSKKIWRMDSNMLSKVNVFEHNESYNCCET